MQVNLGIQKVFACGIQNPTCWNSDPTLWNMESRILENRAFGIQNPWRWNLDSSTCRIQSQHHEIWNPRLAQITLHGTIWKNNLMIKRIMTWNLRTILINVWRWKGITRQATMWNPNGKYRSLLVLQAKEHLGEECRGGNEKGRLQFGRIWKGI